MTYKGHIKNGTVIIDEPVQLPEGAQVEVEIALRPAEPPPEQDGTFYDRFADLIGSCPDLPPDTSAQKRHYLYGHPKS